MVCQSYKHWELILVDDGSTDNSPEIARRYAKLYPNQVSLLTHEGRRNAGVSASRNLGLRQAGGEYVCFLDADDVFLPDKLEKELTILQLNPEAVVVCGAFQYWYSWTGIDSDRHRDFGVTLGVESGRLYQPPDLLIHNLRAGGRKPGTSGIMLRRDRFRVDACDESFVGLGDDQVFWAKVSLLLPIFVIDDCLFKYRQHPDSLCAVGLQDGEDFLAWQRFLTWLDGYIAAENVDDQRVLRALKTCQRSIAWQIRLAPVKHFYRRLLPLRVRYQLRDYWIRLQSLRDF